MSIWVGLDERFCDEADDVKLDSEATELVEESAEESVFIEENAE